LAIGTNVLHLSFRPAIKDRHCERSEAVQTFLFLDRHAASMAARDDEENFSSRRRLLAHSFEERVWVR